MLARAGAISTRPEGETAPLGIGDGGYRLTEIQAQAILEMRLNRLTGLEQDKIIAEYQELLAQIRDLLRHPRAPRAAARRSSATNSRCIREQFADKRRTEIVSNHEDLTIEDLISPEDVVVTLSHGGYAKAQPVSAYQAQRRGGRGKAATSVKDEDFIDKLFVANTHDTLLCFSDRGKVYWLKVYQLPQASRGSRGKPIVNLLPLQEGERISAMLSDQGIRGRQVRVHGDELRHGQEDAARAVLAAARERHHRGRPRRRRQAGRRRDHRRHARHPAVHHAAARRSASSRTRCARWAARPPACAA